jgi:hypothetical protein
MAIQLLGADGTTVAKVDATHGAQRVSMRGPEATGSFLVNVQAATAAAPAAGANLVSLRWGSSTKVALIRHVRLQLIVSTASTAGLPEMAGFVARSFTVSDSAGTAVSFAGSNAKKRTSHVTSEIATNGDMRFANGGALTAGTRTLDPQPFISVVLPIALSAAYFGDVWGGPFNDSPIVLAQNEGLVFQNVTALTAAVSRYLLRIEWDEVASY